MVGMLVLLAACEAPEKAEISGEDSVVKAGRAAALESSLACGTLPINGAVMF